MQTRELLLRPVPRPDARHIQRLLALVAIGLQRAFQDEPFVDFSPDVRVYPDVIDEPPAVRR